MRLLVCLISVSLATCGEQFVPANPSALADALRVAGGHHPTLTIANVPLERVDRGLQVHPDTVPCAADVVYGIQLLIEAGRIISYKDIFDEIIRDTDVNEDRRLCIRIAMRAVQARQRIRIESFATLIHFNQVEIGPHISLKLWGPLYTQERMKMQGSSLGDFYELGILPYAGQRLADVSYQVLRNTLSHKIVVVMPWDSARQSLLTELEREIKRIQAARPTQEAPDDDFSNPAFRDLMYTLMDDLTGPMTVDEYNYVTAHFDEIVGS